MRTEIIEFLAPKILQIRDVELPPLEPNEILIETRASGICMREVHVFQGRLPREFPTVMGHEATGVVLKTGNQVQHVAPGMPVAALGDHCLSRHFIITEDRVVPLNEPANFANMVAEPVMCVVNAIRCSAIEPGDRVAVVGCGYMGLLLIQGLLRTLCTNIVALDVQEERLQLARSLGVDTLLVPRRVTEGYEVIGGLAESYDVVFEVSGALDGLGLATMLTGRGRTLCMFGHQVELERFDFSPWHLKGLRVLNTVPWMSKDLMKDFKTAVDLIQKGVFCNDTLITHKYPFEQAEEAMVTCSSRPQGFLKGMLVMEEGAVK